MERLGRMDVINDRERYSRHTILPQVGENGQDKIKAAKVLVVGAGGLGAPILLYLTAAGIGTIGIMDDDIVSESNLQRQILYDSDTIGEVKVRIAARKLQSINPSCKIIPMQERLSEVNATIIINGYDIVVDATDNLLSRYVINDACVECGKPFVYGSICEFEGQVSVFNYQGGPTYRDLYEYHEGIREFQQPSGVIGALPGVIGSIQASETLKIILGSSDCLSGKLLLVDLWNNVFHTVRLV